MAAPSTRALLDGVDPARVMIRPSIVFCVFLCWLLFFVHVGDWVTRHDDEDEWRRVSQWPPHRYGLRLHHRAQAWRLRFVKQKEVDRIISYTHLSPTPLYDYVHIVITICLSRDNYHGRSHVWMWQYALSAPYSCCLDWIHIYSSYVLPSLSPQLHPQLIQAKVWA